MMLIVSSLFTEQWLDEPDAEIRNGLQASSASMEVGSLADKKPEPIAECANLDCDKQIYPGQKYWKKGKRGQFHYCSLKCLFPDAKPIKAGQ